MCGGGEGGWVDYARDFVQNTMSMRVHMHSLVCSVRTLRCKDPDCSHSHAVQSTTLRWHQSSSQIPLQ